MSWRQWNFGTDEQSVSELADMIEALMHEVAFEKDDPALDEWFDDAGVDLVGGPYGAGYGNCDDGEAVLVFYEMQETDLTDIDGTMKPGYTLSWLMTDGQQETEMFFADDEPQRWKDIARDFAERIACVR